MKKFTKVSATVVAISSALILIGPLTASAATAVAPDLGTVESFSVLSALSAYSANLTTLSGDLGLSPGLVTDRTGSWSVGGTEYFHVPGGVAETAQSDASAAWTSMNQSGTLWSLNPSPAPGVWTAASDAVFDNTLTLTGSATDVWIFNITNDLTFTGTVNLVGGAQACNVFWRINRNATINSGGASSKFVGTLIAHNDVTVVSGATITGRIVSLVGALTTDANIITTPTCAAVVATGGGSTNGTITVVKTVINDSGGTKTVADFPLFVNGTANGHQPVISGETNTFHTNGLYPYTVTETSNPNYTATFSGDCDSTGFLNLRPDDRKVCIITNNDKGAPLPVVPPLIDVVKTASPLSLPNGPGLVTYTYTLRNIGTVPVTDVTMVGDTCSPIVLSSGDTNNDAKLAVNETWVYHCSTTLAATHTNTVTATGWANGISAVDIASATVVVGLPIVPPIIHVVKVPSVFTLSAPGGAVTYTYTVTNPGTVPLSNVTITDNKCTGLPGRVVGHPGDLNKNNLLESHESWSFTCRTNLTQTTTNTATASGEANGMTARDFALATVVVALPELPNTGLPPQSRTPWDIFITAGILMVVSSSLVLALKKRTV